MSYSIDYTWSAVKNIEGTFCMREVCDLVQSRRPDVKKTTLRQAVSKHLRRLTTQGYLRTVSAGYNNGAFCYLYEVIYHG